MDIKYGSIPSPAFNDYKDSLINRIWILLPLKEENCVTLTENIERLNRELSGLLKVASQHNKYILTMISLLENAMTEEDFSAYRSDILRCCELAKKLDGGDRNE